MSLDVEVIRTPGLGDSTYVLTHEQTSVVVDPQRDIDRVLEVLASKGSEARFVLETHIHNDYVSGGLPLSKTTGAELVMPAGAAPVFRHTPAYHMEEVSDRGLSILPVHTPGHTPEHTSYIIGIGDDRFAVLSGGSLLVGAAGRTDLLGEERAESLARLQHGSVRRLAALDPQLQLLPTHGAGSFCTVTGVGALISTIGQEKDTNPLLRLESEDEFVEAMLSGLVPYPSYYRHMAPINLSGPDAARLDAPEIETPPDGVTVIDARPATDFAAGHMEGSISVPLTDSFGTWVGWLTEHDEPLVLVVSPDQSLDEALRQLARVGYDKVVGVLREPVGALDSYEVVDLDRFVNAVEEGAQVLDVRAPDEWESGTIPGSVTRYLPDVARSEVEEIGADSRVWLACGTGHRAGIAASFLESRGLEPVVLVGAGVPEVLERLS